MVSSSQWSASRTASATASCCRWVGDGSGAWATVLRAMSRAKSQLIGPSWGCISDCIWLNSWPRSGMPPPDRRREELLEGRAAERVLVLAGTVAGVVAHGPKLLGGRLRRAAARR